MENESNPDSHFIKLANNINVVVKTWSEILSAIKLQLIQDNDQYLSDIDQIIGFCETVDSNAFMPFQDGDFSPSKAKRINSFYDIADKVISELGKRGFADTKGLKIASQRCGYSRYFRIDKLEVALNVRFDFWEKVADTPFWIYFGWVQNKDHEHLKKAVKIIASKRSIITYENNNCLYLPIYPLFEKTEDIVVKDIAEQIIKFYDELNKIRTGS